MQRFIKALFTPYLENKWYTTGFWSVHEQSGSLKYRKEYLTMGLLSYFSLYIVLILFLHFEHNHLRKTIIKLILSQSLSIVSRQLVEITCHAALFDCNGTMFSFELLRMFEDGSFWQWKLLKLYVFIAYHQRNIFPEKNIWVTDLPKKSHFISA